MHPALRRRNHRPWPVPDREWTWRQSWCDLLFAHWPVPAALLRPLVPAELEIEEFGGTAWIGVVPFRMEGVMRRPLPDLPGISAFPELNVRTYVTHGGKPGVWFLSLDATNALAVWAARKFFHLPYRHAEITTERAKGGAIQYKNWLDDEGEFFSATYASRGPAREAIQGSLEHFLTERYCLYAHDGASRLFRADVHHAPWPLQSADVHVATNSMGRQSGIALAGQPELAHFARRLDVVVWSPEVVVP